ncbi:hypothetical protein Tco_0177191, partial [Tanacetum coccineum]
EAEASAADMREIAIDPLAIGDSYESSRGGIPNLEDIIYDIVHYMLQVRIDSITVIKIHPYEHKIQRLGKMEKKSIHIIREKKDEMGKGTIVVCMNWINFPPIHAACLEKLSS